jgi:xanthine/uracil permease
MTNHSEQPGHGSSPAAWVAVTIMLIGVAVGTLFLFLDVLPMVYLGAVLILVGLVVGWLLARAGFGVNGSKTAH